MMLALVLAAAAQNIAPPAAVWTITGPPGAVRSVTATVKTGGRIVADDFVRDAALAGQEKRLLAQAEPRRGSCARAAAVRPFTRLRRYASNGRLLWTWNVAREEQALRLLSPAPGDCLSPDGGRLLVVSYRLAPGEPMTELGGAIVAVDRRPRFVKATGRRSGEDFGELNRTASLGWRRGSDATLVFYLVQDASEARDEAVLGRRP